MTSLVKILSNSRSTYHIPDTQPSAPAVLNAPEWGVCMNVCFVVCCIAIRYQCLTSMRKGPEACRDINTFQQLIYNELCGHVIGPGCPALHHRLHPRRLLLPPSPSPTARPVFSLPHSVNLWHSGTYSNLMVCFYKMPAD